MNTRETKLTERQVDLWIRLQDLSIELHGYSFNMRFQKLRVFFIELLEITEDTKAVNGRTFNRLINKIGYISCEIIYGMQIYQIHEGQSSERYPKSAFKIFTEIYNYKVGKSK